MSNDVPGSVIVSRFKLPFLEECPEDWGGIYFGKWHLLDFHFHLNRTISGESGVNSISCCLKAHLVLAIETRTRKAAARVNAWSNFEGHAMDVDRHCKEKTCGMILQLVQFQFISGDIAIMCSGSIPTYGCQTSTVPPVCKRALATYLYNLMCPGGHLWWAGWTPATIPSNQLDISTTIKPNRQSGELNELS
jgi:hypothetical protein